MNELVVKLECFGIEIRCFLPVHSSRLFIGRNKNNQDSRHFSLIATLNISSPFQRSDREGRQSSLKRDCRGGQDAVYLDPTDASPPPQPRFRGLTLPERRFGKGEVGGDQREVSNSIHYYTLNDFTLHALTESLS
jgi:hypothetical protein